MRYLLDTHVLLWWLSNDPCLSEAARRVISDGSHEILVRSAAAWEIAIKKALGKLEAPDSLREALIASAFQPLDITIAHALVAGALPPHHADPFDRMLVAQAQIEELTLITADERLEQYEVQILRV